MSNWLIAATLRIDIWQAKPGHVTSQDCKVFACCCLAVVLDLERAVRAHTVGMGGEGRRGASMGKRPGWCISI